MTDIWRSFVAQICLYAAGYFIAFRGATVFQLRNAHDLMRDFRDEVDGYLNNRGLVAALGSLRLSHSPGQMGENLRVCYWKLAAEGLVPAAELDLVGAWLDAVGTCGMGTETQVDATSR
jgi:hypothetical protein